MNAVSVENLCFAYEQSDNLAINNVSFNIKEGEFCTIVGTNGSGKSTLAHLLTNLLPITSGTITINNKSTIGLVLQSPKNQIICGLVKKDVSFGPINLGLKLSEVELRTIECLTIVDLLEKAEKSSLNLSLGQTQKLALAGNLALFPNILIIDEGLSMLDKESKESIKKFIDYWHKKGNTIIHITHELDSIKQSEHVIGIKEGKVFFDGSTKDFFTSKKLLLEITGEKLQVCDRKKINEELKTKDYSLEFCDVSFKYESEQNNCIQDLSFKIHKGSLVALTGPSGTGKSTILELASGLLLPTKGNIFCNKNPSLALQNCSEAVFEQIACDDVAFGLINNDCKENELLQRVQNAMNSVNLDFNQFAEKKVNTLSGGQLRRLSIAGIIALDNDVFLFDEPTAGLDGKSRQEVMNFLKDLSERGKTVIFSTHNKEEADFSQREIRILKGKIVYDSFVPKEINQSSKDNSCKPCNSEQKKLEYSSFTQTLSFLRSISNSLSGSVNYKKKYLENVHPFFRIVLFLILFVFALFTKNLIFNSVMFFVSLVYCFFCNISFKKLFKSFYKILPFLLIFAILQLIFRKPLATEKVYLALKYFYITPSKLLFCLASLLRTYSALFLIFGFYTSIKEYELIQGLKVLFYPLEKIKVPMRYFYIILEVLFRFIPLLVDQACAIIKTQIIRGSFKQHKSKIKKIKAVLPLIVPLFIQTIKRSEYLADAMTIRCFK